MTQKVVIRPQPGPQEQFLAAEADLVIYGGAAGGGKTWALLVDPLRHISVKGFGGVIFRKTYPEISSEGGLWDEAIQLYPLFGGRPRFGMLDFTFDAGSAISFAHLQLEQDKLKYQGSQIPYLGFDELTHFSEGQFFYMLSRNRSKCGVRPYVRATCNPDPDSWVRKFLDWWIDEETGFAIPERSGVLRWFVRQGDEIVWASSPSELPREYGDAQIPKSVTFIPASIYDNQILLRADPGYLSNLMSLPYVDRKQLLEGNWKIRAGAGKVFNREWFEIVPNAPTVPEGGVIKTLLNGAQSISLRPLKDDPRHPLEKLVDGANGVNGKHEPVEVVECRFWDFASTEPSKKNADPDYTAGVKIRRVGNTFYVTDVVWGRWSPVEVDKTFIQVVRSDYEESQKLRIPYRCRWEIEPGSAGLRENSRLIALLAGIDARGERPGTGDKITRAKPLAVQCEAGYVKIVFSKRWNDYFINHLHHQPEMPHDDLLDSAVGAFTALMKGEVKVASSHRG